MDVQESAPVKSLSARARRGASERNRPPSRARIGQALGEWQASELRYMSGHPHCRGLSLAQLEDLYQETVLALLNRPFFNEEHLRNALRFGLSKRALHVHRDERRRSEILIEHAPEAHLNALRRSEIEGPEQTALAREDGRIVLEFISELEPLECQVYALEAEGLRYRAIAPILNVDVNEARNASRSLASKQKRFQLLHDTGRLCGYRAPTIRTLLAGESTSEELALAAFAHLDACPSCRAEHRTNSRRLRVSFQQRAAALLPVPALTGHLGFLTRVDVRTRTLAQRWLPDLSTSANGGVRERVIASAAGSGVAAKLAAGAATVVIVAGGTLGASHLQARRHHGAGKPHARSARPTSPTARDSAAANSYSRLRTSTPPPPSRVSGAGARARRREPGGFAFLGVPAGTPSPSPSRAQAASTGSAERSEPAQRSVPSDEHQSGGGPFSP